MSTNNDIDKSFVSSIDKFMFEFDAKHAKSLSQLKEIEKHQRIALMRDNKNYPDQASEIWEDF